MPTKLRSPTITRTLRSSTQSQLKGSKRRVAYGRLPKNRAPTHPGEMILEEFLRPIGMSQTELAERLNVSFPRLNEIIRKRRAVTPDTALRLSRVLGMSASFWLGLQLDWDLWKAMAGESYSRIQRLRPIGAG